MDEPWKDALAAKASIRRSGRGQGVEALLSEIAGDPLSIRQVRGSLFLIARQVLAGSPRMMAIESAPIVLIALADLIEVLEKPSPTLKDGLAKAGFKPARRK